MTRTKFSSQPKQSDFGTAMSIRAQALMDSDEFKAAPSLVADAILAAHFQEVTTEDEAAAVLRARGGWSALIKDEIRSRYGGRVEDWGLFGKVRAFQDYLEVAQSLNIRNLAVMRLMARCGPAR